MSVPAQYGFGLTPAHLYLLLFVCSFFYRHQSVGVNDTNYWPIGCAYLSRLVLKLPSLIARETKTLPRRIKHLNLTQFMWFRFLRANWQKLRYGTHLQCKYFLVYVSFLQFFFEITALWSVYTENQRQCCDVASNIVLIKLVRFLNKPNKSLQNWTAITIDQIWYKHWCSHSKSIIDA